MGLDTEDHIVDILNRLNFDTGAAVTAFTRTFVVSDAVGNGSHYMTAFGELTP